MHIHSTDPPLIIFSTLSFLIFQLWNCFLFFFHLSHWVHFMLPTYSWFCDNNSLWIVFSGDIIKEKWFLSIAFKYTNNFSAKSVITCTSYPFLLEFCIAEACKYLGHTVTITLSSNAHIWKILFPSRHQ